MHLSGSHLLKLHLKISKVTVLVTYTDLFIASTGHVKMMCLGSNEELVYQTIQLVTAIDF